MRSGERGSALVLALLVMAILTLLGISYLMMADTENRIAENERLSAQALYFGEGVTREVKRWFDRPPYTAEGTANLVRPTAALLDRTRRIIDTDGAGPSARVPADGTTAFPYYKAGVDNDGDGNDDIFDRPYRPALADMFVGTVDGPVDGPDVLIDRVTGGSATAAFLDSLAEKVMPGFPSAAGGVLARIKAVKVYAPPYLHSGGGNWSRYGVATVSTQVQILRNPGRADEQVLADRTITAVLNETPYVGVFGPLHSCDELAWDNAFKVHWGPATAGTTANVPTGTRNGMSLSIPRDLPASPKLDSLHGHLSPSGDSDWTALSAALEGKTIEDPWFRFFAGLDVQNWSALGSPQVYPPWTSNQDESNKFQNYPNVTCPEFDYDTWKTVAKSGGSDVHYFAWDRVTGGSNFRENGVGTSADFETLTDGKTGLFFFDTRDGQAPHGFDAGNVADNLTPDIKIMNGGYGTRGFLYVNTRMWRVQGSPGRPAKFTFPGEPFRDKNENGVYEKVQEAWINLRYSTITAIDSPLVVDSTDTYDTSSPPPTTPAAIWNPKGPTVDHDAIVWGILYLSGQFDASGTPYYDGSVVTYAGTATGVKTAGTASLYWDPGLKENWPPPDWDLPRVIITGWQTDE
jgi:type II secretory pathway pseudopilin PulG